MAAEQAVVVVQMILRIVCTKCNNNRNNPEGNSDGQKMKDTSGGQKIKDNSDGHNMKGTSDGHKMKDSSDSHKRKDNSDGHMMKDNSDGQHMGEDIPEVASAMINKQGAGAGSVEGKSSMDCSVKMLPKY